MNCCGTSPAENEPDVNRDIATVWKEGPIAAVYKPPNLPMHEGGPIVSILLRNC